MFGLKTDTVYIRQFEALQPLLRDANHVDVKTVEGAVTLREFIAAMLAYYPGWLKFLYRVRGVFVRLLGMKQEGLPEPAKLRPEDVPMRAGQKADFFILHSAVDGRYWIAEAVDKHLSAALGIVVEPLDDRRNRFYVVTIVHYKNWAGPVYFNIIRPFHHLVVRQMARAGVATS